MRFWLSILPSLLLILLQSEAVVRWCSAKKVLQQIPQILQESTWSKTQFSWSCRSTEFNFKKKEILAQMFYCEFSEISHKTFFKEPFGRLLLHKHSFRLFSQLDLVPFQKRCHIYFSAEYFLDLICRLGPRVSSIFQTLS